MKFAFCLLVVLPLALSAPLTAEEEDFDKRFIFGSFQVKLPSVDELEQQLLGVLGSDLTEGACEKACPAALNALVPGAGLLGGSLCTSTCLKLQSTVQG